MIRQFALPLLAACVSEPAPDEIQQPDNNLNAPVIDDIVFYRDSAAFSVEGSFDNGKLESTLQSDPRCTARFHLGVKSSVEGDGLSFVRVFAGDAHQNQANWQGVGESNNFGSFLETGAGSNLELSGNFYATPISEQYISMDDNTTLIEINPYAQGHIVDLPWYYQLYIRAENELDPTQVSKTFRVVLNDIATDNDECAF